VNKFHTPHFLPATALTELERLADLHGDMRLAKMLGVHVLTVLRALASRPQQRRTVAELQRAMTALLASEARETAQ
jgi:hypothetical protein